LAQSHGCRGVKPYVVHIATRRTYQTCGILQSKTCRRVAKSLPHPTCCVTATSHPSPPWGHCLIPPQPSGRGRGVGGVQLKPHPAGGRDQVCRPEPRTPAGGHSPGVSGPGGLRSPVRVTVSTHALQGSGCDHPPDNTTPPERVPGGCVWCAGYLPRVTCISRYFHETSVRPTGEVVSPSSAERSPPICHLIGCVLPVTNFAASAM